MPEAADTAKVRLRAQFQQRPFDRRLKTAGHILARLAHVPEHLKREILPKAVRLLQPHAHHRFSSRMIRSTMPRISSGA